MSLHETKITCRQIDIVYYSTLELTPCRECPSVSDEDPQPGYCQEAAEDCSVLTTLTEQYR